MKDRFFSSLGASCGALRERAAQWSMVRKGRAYPPKGDEPEPDFPVDLVVLWVDGRDPVWQSKRQQYAQERETGESSASGIERYRTWGTFRYWFRLLEKYVPWVNRVYVVTDEQIPDFLDLSNPRVQIVDHREIIDADCLPLFNSNAIEINVHRIEGLSEHFVYLNDDVFFAGPVRKGDFFSPDGLPRYAAVASPFVPTTDSSTYLYNLMNCVAVFNDAYPDIRPAIRAHPEKWFSRVYSKAERKGTLASYQWGKLLGVHPSHLGVPYRRSTCYQVWDLFPEVMHRTAASRFRSAFDVSHPMYMLRELLNGSFESVGSDHYGKVYPVSRHNIGQITEDFSAGRYRMICVNDSARCSAGDFPALKEQLLRTLEALLPEPCSFEHRQ